MVLESGTSGETTYRSNAGPAGWRGTPGRREEQLRTLRHRVVGRSLLALSILAITAMPLLVVGRSFWLL